MDASASALDADDRANELYWGSEMSVNQIADALDLSKGALYEMIRPLAAAIGCPRCHAEAVFGNRTAKERGLVACPACGWAGTEDEAVAVGADGPMGYIEPKAARGKRASARAPAPRSDAPLTGRPRSLGGVLLGVAAGLALVLWARRR